MDVNKSQEKTLRLSLKYWHKAGLIDDKTMASLEKTIQTQLFDWKKVVKYSFWVSLACIVISIGAVLADERLIRLLQAIFNASHLTKFVILSILSGSIYWIGFTRSKEEPGKRFSNEAILFLGVLTTAGSVYQFGRILNLSLNHVDILLLLSSIVYGVLGLYSKSNLIWIFSLFSLGSWMGAETGYMSGWGAYYLGMNYPIRFIPLGGILTVVALVFEENKKFSRISQSTLVMGMLYLFISLWLLSIFGNYGDLQSWSNVKQIELFHWSILFALVSVGCICHGLKYGNEITKGFGITFIFINLYTRFFEYFWDTTHKAIFFGLLAISLWMLGSKTEKIWQLGKNKSNFHE